ncbi:glycosyltransferase family 9 protein [Kibdelosporangium phytohabitans]|uniref:Glycosyl transferase n=1 Tax=Kibdelosporangium phytohabitans TaxID=860235 RepID=A0A0N9I6X4_9PSEU|nr:glycosyltransferase family 9 protein [Kibdelosporangium phytohabitans]ALG10500.1 glycosyl transferase [Kibdelosporangium phytohabitans]MBE1461590.1 ADP-heptose:LPS heptosyltransferase [Kibdelosporangium phytohabitans]
MKAVVVRLDSDGDVLTAGPAVRAVAGRAEVTFLCGPQGRQAADILPGVAEVWQWACPWILADPPDVSTVDITGLVTRLAGFDVALVLTSFHQSPLPMALLLRMAGVRRIAAISTDYPGSLVDHRIRPGIDIDDDQPEPLKALRVAQAAGFTLPLGDNGGLRVRTPPDTGELTGRAPYVVVHPGASVPARAWSPDRCAEAVIALSEAGHRVVVTGAPDEKELTARVAGADALDLGGRTTFPALAGVLAGAEAVVVGNTGPAHLAAAVGTPVVSLFAPVVPASRWAPYGVPVAVLGDQQAACRDTRATQCPLAGHPCLNSITAADVVAAVRRLT